MSDTKWTKGPWHLNKNARAYVESDEHGVANAACWDTSTRDIEDEQWANAHLIAAAHDGYALAEMVMDICGNPKGVSGASQEELYEAALQYAKKARGES